MPGAHRRQDDPDAATGVARGGRCRSRRVVTVALRRPRGGRVVSTSVAVDGRRPRTWAGLRSRVRVDLRGLARGRHHVRIALRLRGGRTVVQRRTLRTCSPRR
ncbi:hypothetical protein [Conexibacter sp. SYSU D00693]|uniref:hypothetical protein n=1 Tax=Conexibacter sp. SYSU D00693 TaxID=2812560 RepID=UPI00196B5135|nr:hypothetical protein [Conexibacter sp. SYSU D00693]